MFFSLLAVALWISVTITFVFLRFTLHRSSCLVFGIIVLDSWRVHWYLGASMKLNWKTTIHYYGRWSSSNKDNILKAIIMVSLENTNNYRYISGSAHLFLATRVKDEERERL